MSKTSRKDKKKMTNRPYTENVSCSGQTSKVIKMSCQGGNITLINC